MDLSKITITRTSLFPRRYLVFDDRYHKIGSVEFRRGVWYCIDTQTNEEYMGLTRDEAIRDWLNRFEN